MDDALLLPVVTLVAWTFLVLLLIPIRRFRAAYAGKVNKGDFRYGESTRVPGEVSLPNRNYMNLLELPVLFYLLCLLLIATRRVDQLQIWLAWAFVALRILHSIVHMTYNNVMHRLVVFAVGTAVLMVMWGGLALSLLAPAR